MGTCELFVSNCEQIWEPELGFTVRYTVLPRGCVHWLSEIGQGTLSLGCHSRVHSANVSSCLSLNISQRTNGTRLEESHHPSSITSDTGHIFANINKYPLSGCCRVSRPHESRTPATRGASWAHASVEVKSEESVSPFSISQVETVCHLRRTLIFYEAESLMRKSGNLSISVSKTITQPFVITWSHSARGAMLKLWKKAFTGNLLREHNAWQATVTSDGSVNLATNK